MQLSEYPEAIQKAANAVVDKEWEIGNLRRMMEEDELEAKDRRNSVFRTNWSG